MLIFYKLTRITGL